MIADSLLTTARPSWANLVGEVRHGEIALTFRADKSVVMNAADARDLARWLMEAATRSEGGMR